MSILRCYLPKGLLSCLVLLCSMSYAQNAVRDGITPGRKDWIVFAAAGCEECRWLKTTFLPELAERLGITLPRVVLMDLDQSENYEALMAVEAQLGTNGEDVPAFLVGKRMLYGKREIAAWGEDITAAECRQLLDPAIPPTLAQASPRHYVGAQAPEVSPMPVPDEPKASAQADAAGYRAAGIIYFHTTGCQACARAGQQLSYLAKRFPEVSVFRVETSDVAGKLLQMAVARRLDVPEKNRLITPMFVSGTRALLGKSLTDQEVIDLFESAPTAPFWSRWNEAEAYADARRRLGLLAEKFTIPAVILAGIGDGINPCAFAVIVFLISYLTLTGGLGRRYALLFGLVFTAGVYTCYFLIGLGFLRLLDVLSAWSQAVRWTLLTTGCVCLVFAVGAGMDTVAAYRGGAAKMRFGMPKRLHRLIHLLIRRSAGRGLLVVTAFVLGLAVSALELVCTGQIYLPVLVYINQVSRGARSLAFLAVYCFAFIVPLLAVVGLGVGGFGSARLAAWGRRHAVATRALAFALVLALAIAMFVMAWRQG